MSIEDLKAWKAKEDAKADRLLQQQEAAIGTEQFNDIDDQVIAQLGRVAMFRELLAALEADTESARPAIRMTSKGRDVLREMEIALQRPALEIVPENKGGW